LSVSVSNYFPFALCHYTSLLYLVAPESQIGSLAFSVLLVSSLVMGIVLNFTMFWCTIVNSALTTTIVGVLKGVVTTVSLYPSWNSLSVPFSHCSSKVLELSTSYTICFICFSDPRFCSVGRCGSTCS
jgi:hypothetical protein